MLAPSNRKRIVLYLALNVLFLVVLAIGTAIGGQENPRLAYLVLLFALCTTAVIDLDGLNRRYILLALFLGMYFIYFGVQDLTNLYVGTSSGDYPRAISPSEAIILVGGALLILGYRIAVSFRNRGVGTARGSDWPVRSIVLVGLAMWALGIIATYYWYFYVVIDKTIEGTRGIARLGQLTTTALVLAEMLQPLGTLLLAYAWRVTRNKALFAMLIGIVAVQVVLGFVIDIKGMAINGALLVVVTMIFTDGRIPKLWVAGMAIFVYLAFPVFQAYRAVITGNVARTEVVSNLGEVLDRVLMAKEKVNTGRERAQTFLERLSLKASVELIVTGTANGIPFQHGYTMSPLLSAFLPRIIWSDKPDIPTGRIVNKVFKVTDQEETYISPSHLGELYWNFGWPGVVIGMLIIGAICGTVARFNLGEGKTVTRLLTLVLAEEYVIHGFEGSLSNYVVWMRCMAAVAILHLIFARRARATSSGAASGELNQLPLRGAAPKFDPWLHPAK